MELLEKPFLDVDDICDILKVKKSTGWKVIQRLNQELMDEGIMVKRGLVNTSYFKKRYGLTEEIA